MSHYMTALAMKQKGIKPSAKIVLYWLADHYNGETKECFPSHKRLAECCEMTRQSIINQLKILQDGGFINILPRYRDNGSHTSNTYQLLLVDVEKDKEVVKNFDIPSQKIEHGIVDNLYTHNQVNNNQVKEPKDNIPEITYFEETWENYPRKVGKGAAKKAWMKACNKIHNWELRNAVFEYIDSVNGKTKKFIPHLSTWLNQERWDDELEKEEPTTSSHFINNLLKAKPMGIEKQ